MPDISDLFDDDSLKDSIEAGQQGPWRDENAKFVDPKLEELRQQMTVGQRRSYRERRIEDLERRAQQAPPSQQAQQPPAAAPWGEGNTWRDPEATAAAPAAEEPKPRDDAWQAAIVPLQPAAEALAPETEPRPDDARESAVEHYLPSVFAAVLVFGAAAVAHCAVAGIRVDLMLRAVVASAVAGVLWRRFEVGRGQAAAIGTAVYLVAFSSSAKTVTRTEQFALFFGLLIALAGSGLIGARDADVDRRRR
jgi:hypothetical protein